MFTEEVGKKCTTAAPLNILQSKHFGESGMSALFRTLRRRDFSPERILPKSDSDGGNVWFSCEKNCNKSPSRCWLAMYKRPKSEALLRWSVSCCDVFDFFLHMGVLKRGSEFFLSDSWMDLFLSKITSWQYCWYFAVAIDWIDRTVPITELSAQSLEFKINNSGQSSKNGFPKIL